MPRKVTLTAKFEDARNALRNSMIDRDAEIDVVLTALICQENPVLVGAPGTGKSMLLDGLLKWMDKASKFNLCFNRFTTPEEVFGPISVQGMKNDEYRRVTTGKLPEADVAFFDEVFKANSAILNAMLRILNEGVYEKGDGTYQECPLRIGVAASNEWPEQEELGALFDRFLFRKTVAPVSQAKLDDLLWTNHEGPKFKHTITSAELDKAHQEAMALEFSDQAKESFRNIIEELLKKGVQPGDRRMVKSIGAAKGFAWLNGDKVVQPEHLTILQHTLWDDPNEQPAIVRKVVLQYANPVSMKVADLTSKALDVVRKNEPTERVPKLQLILTDLKAIQDDLAFEASAAVHDEVELACTDVAAMIAKAYNQVIGYEVS